MRSGTEGSRAESQVWESIANIIQKMDVKNAFR